jgi:Ca-activated chloride channel homolog
VQVAKECIEDRIRIDVVQIGGRAPEVIPNVGPDGKVNGLRKEADGTPMMTSLTADGEAQLARVASESNGTIVRSENGETGIDKVAQSLSRMMKDELSERVETVYGEEYAWPLGIALLLLVLEAMIGEAPKKKGIAKGLPAVAPRRKRKKRVVAEGGKHVSA